MATPSLKWDASDVALKVTTASGGVVTMSFPDRASDIAFNMPLTALTNPMTTAGDVIVATTDGVPARVAIGTNGQVLQSNGTTAVWATLSYLTNPMTTAQDIIVGGTSGAPARLAVGTEGQVLSVTSGAVAWVEPSAGFTNPMTTAQDIIVGGAGGAAGRLAVGAEGQVLTVSSGVVAWANAPTGFTNPMTAEGDIILGGALGAASRLGIGTNGQVLTSNGTTASWASPSSGFTNPMTTLGDIITADTGGTAKRVGVGSEGQVLKVVSGEPAWATESAGSSNQYEFVDLPTVNTYASTTENFSNGCRFFTANDTSCIGARVYIISGDSAKIKLYNASGTLLASKTATASATGAMNITFDTPVALTANAIYEISAWCQRGTGYSAYTISSYVYSPNTPFLYGPSLCITTYAFSPGDARPTNLTGNYKYPCYPRF